MLLLQYLIRHASQIPRNFKDFFKIGEIWRIASENKIVKSEMYKTLPKMESNSRRWKGC
jgi:hypothetical protein